MISVPRTSTRQLRILVLPLLPSFNRSPDTMSNHRTLLGDFIRAHRDRLTPHDVGLAPGMRRRVKGLRREELALICGISVTWLTWIEQGRAPALTAATLTSLAKALQLSQAERLYLFELAGLRHGREGTNHVDPASLHAVSEAVGKVRTPAYVLNKAWHAVAWNRMAAALFTQWLGSKIQSKNLLEYMFLCPDARTFVDDWSQRASRLVAEFRADVSSNLKEPDTSDQVASLRERSAEFDCYWRLHDVLDREGGRRVFIHPTRGTLLYQQLTLRVANASELKLVVLLEQHER